MTDKEIIKASENLLFNRNCVIAKSGEQFITLGDILDLINRQQAEHDKLKNNYRETLTKQVELCDVIEKQQAENENYSHNIKNLTAENMQLHAEIKRLNSCVKSEDEVRAIMKSQMTPMVKEIVNEQFDVAVKLARAEAIKEFIEKLKDLSYDSDLYDRNGRWVKAVTVKEIDETYKEMMGEDK